MCLFLFEEVGKGPIISQDIFSNGWVALILPSSACGLGLEHCIAKIVGILVPISQYPARIPASRIFHTLSASRDDLHCCGVAVGLLISYQ